MPTISIITPVYKADKYLVRCLDSILAQTFKDWELILVDDGSPDRSGAICDEYAVKDSRIRVIHKANGGVSAARQDGLEAAQGDYVIHVDPDDWIEPDMLQALYEKAVAEDADMVMCDYYDESASARKIINQKPTARDNETVFKELFSHLNGACFNKLVRRSLFDKFGIAFPSGLVLLEDLYVTAMLCIHNISIAYVPKPLYHYVLDANPASLVKRRGRDSVESICRFVKLLAPYFDERGMENEKFLYKYRARSFAYDSRLYSRQEMRCLFPEIDRIFAHRAITASFKTPWVTEVWLGQYLPRIVGKVWCALAMRLNRVVGARE